MLVRVIPKSVIHSLLNLSICLSKNFFPKFVAISVPFLVTLNKIFPKIGNSWIKIPPDYIILYNLVIENFILADEPFAKALQIFETCVSVNNNLCRKLFSSI